VTENPGFATKPTLVGQFVVLRPFTEADLPAMREALLDADARILTGSVHDDAAAHAPQSPDEETLLRDWYRTRNDQADRLDLAVADKATGACVGEVVLNQWDPGNESCNFRILLRPRGRDRGLGSRAEGVLRESLRYDGTWVDATVMSILAPEWPAPTVIDNSKKLVRTDAGRRGSCPLRPQGPGTGIPGCPRLLLLLSVTSSVRSACRACKRRTTSHLVGQRAGGFGAALIPA
jgi:RimJ/RimL family protein N-acetyltransferase